MKNILFDTFQFFLKVLDSFFPKSDNAIIFPLDSYKDYKDNRRFLFDSLNAQTPFIGSAGVFDVLSRAAGKFLDREEAAESNKIQRQLAIGELAAKQAAEANKDLFVKEAELRAKLLGYNQDLNKSYLNFDETVREKNLKFNLDEKLERIKTSNEMLKNLQKPISMVYTLDGENYIPTAVQLRPNEDMTEIVPYSLQKVEKEDGTTGLEFREGAPEGTKNFYFTTSVSDPSVSATEASKLAGPSASQFQEAQATYFGLKDAGNLVDEGYFDIDGKLPVNLSGGLLAKGHPTGATGVANLYEICTQLRGEAGQRQLKNPNIGLAHVIGLGSACGIHILEKSSS